MTAACPLCDADGGIVVHRAPRWRVVRADEADFPAFYRVVWQAHRAEFTDLDAAERAEVMSAVAAVESALRRELRPDKINLASLGNVVPHLHWHVIARFAWDSRFPQPVWAPAQRSADAAALHDLTARLPALDTAVRDAAASAARPGSVFA